jgi:hypothetical protein
MRETVISSGQGGDCVRKNFAEVRRRYYSQSACG